MPKHGFKVLGLAVMAALGMMAFSATAAQATLVLRHTAILLNGTTKEEGGVTVSKGTFLKTGEPKTAAGTQEGTAILKIPAKNAEIQCGKGTVTEASVENETDTKKNPEGKELPNTSESGTAGMGKGTITFSECSVFLGGVKSEPCTKGFNELNNGGKPSAKVLVLTLLHLKVVPNLATHFKLVRLSPLAGPAATFTTLSFGELCALPSPTAVKGSIAGEIVFPMPFEDGKLVKASFDSETAFGKELNTNAEAALVFGASPAYIKGNISAEIPGIEKWGVM